MSSTQVKLQPLTGAEALDLLPALPQRAASAVKKCLDGVTLDNYKHFLYAMYHYTLDSEAKLLHAAEQCSDPKLKAYFEEMAREERGHYLLAQRDIEAFNIDIVGSQEPEPVIHFRNYWYELGKQNVNEFVGAMYVFESVASLCVNEVKQLVSRLELNKRQSRWLLVHLEADEGHGAEALKVCEQYVGDDPEALLSAAKSGVEKWISVFEDAFSNTLSPPLIG